MTEVTWTEADGVPVASLAAAGPLRAALFFRAGTAYETAATHGITHFVEHLALHGLHTRSYACNGGTALVRTVFHAEGTPEEMAEFLGTVCGRLRDLPPDRVETERNVLQAEARQRPGELRDALLVRRFGAQTYGLSALDEFGLGHLTADALAQWAAERFTRADAVLALSGPPPAGLRLPLGDGQPHPEPPARPLELPTPAWFRLDWTGFGCGALLSPSLAATVACHVVADELMRELRFEAGLTYAVTSGVDVLTAEAAHAVFAAESDRAGVAELKTRFVRVVERLAADGPDERALAQAKARWGRGNADDRAAAHLLLAVEERLRGLPYVPLAESAAAVAALTADDLAPALAALAESALYALPPGLVLDPARYPRAVPPRAPVSGTTYRSSGAPGDRDSDQRLVVGPDGVSLTRPDRTTTVRWADTVAALQWSDGGRWLVGRDGCAITVVPADWRDGRTAAARIDAAVPPSSVVPMPGEGPAREWRSDEVEVVGYERQSPMLFMMLVAIGGLFSWALLRAAAPGRRKVDLYTSVPTGRSWGLTVFGVLLLLATVAGAGWTVRWQWRNWRGIDH